MSLDFGTIQDYDSQRGFGFVNGIILASDRRHEKIFFHITKIKRKDFHLARNLDNGQFNGVGFWYDTETTPRGKQVSELWLTTEEIPELQRTQLITHIENLWRDIQTPPPPWLDQVTIKLVNQSHRDQLSQKRENLIRQKLESEAEKARLEKACLEKARLDAEKRKQEEIKRLIEQKVEQAKLIRQKREFEAKKARLEAEKRQEEETERRKAEERRKQEEAQQLARQAEKLRVEKQRAYDQQLAQQRIEKQRAYIALNQRRKNEIQQVCQHRKITTCVHFTHIQNLRSILQNGLLSRSFLESRRSNIRPQYNDSYRLDRCQEAICLSVSFPNYRMFYKYSNQNREDWVVLLLDASLLWDLDCAFCQQNAAANLVTQIPLEERKQSRSFQQMFEDDVQIQRQNLGILEHYPTNPQAEVLVFDKIPPEYINAVHFSRLTVVQGWLDENNDICGNCPQNFFFYGEQYFRPREDWQSWQNQLVTSSYSNLDEF